MPPAIPLKKDSGQSVRLELTLDEIIAHTSKVREIKDKAMQERIHYGIIPGYRKPSLWKPGAEILCRAFRLEPEFATTLREDLNRTIWWDKRDFDETRILDEGLTQGYIEYDTQCSLVHIETGEVWIKNLNGSCNNFETNYRWLNPYDIRNTIEKMAEKRALVGAVLIGVGASDIFTQDLEDIPGLVETNPADGDKPPAGTPKDLKKGSPPVRYATSKQVDFIKDQIKKKGITDQAFFDDWVGDFIAWDQIPFTLVNDILDWIRDQKAKKK